MKNEMKNEKDAIDCLKKRRSVRVYLDEEIPEKILKDIIDCARLAPSADNIQPWEFIIVRDKKILQEIADLTDYGNFISNAAACIVVICEDTKYYLEDGCAASENILVAARAYGIGSCWVAGDKKKYAQDILKLLNVPFGYKLISLLPLGYCDKFPKPHGKRNVDEILHWNKF